MEDGEDHVPYETNANMRFPCVSYGKVPLYELGNDVSYRKVVWL